MVAFALWVGVRHVLLVDAGRRTTVHRCFPFRSVLVRGIRTQFGHGCTILSTQNIPSRPFCCHLSFLAAAQCGPTTSQIVSSMISGILLLTMRQLRSRLGADRADPPPPPLFRDLHALISGRQKQRALVVRTQAR
jgi:hypothetical protein